MKKDTNWNRIITNEKEEIEKKVYTFYIKKVISREKGDQNMLRNLFIDHRVVFEEGEEKYAVYAGVFQMSKNSLHYPVQIYIHKGMAANPIPLHHHAGIEIIYSRNKKFTVTVDGKKTCLNPGGFVLISNEALHSVMPLSDGVRQDVMYVSFQPDYLLQMSPYLCSQELSAASVMEES